MASHDDVNGPPEPPHLRRRFKLWRHQIITIPLLLAIPVLGLAGVFDEDRDRRSAADGGLEMTVEAPARIRTTGPTTADIELRNVGAEPLSRVEVEFDESWVDGFDDARFVPEPEEPFVVPVGDIAPGETRRVSLELKAGDHGVHTGTVTARAAGAEASLRLRTWVLP